LIKNYGKLSKPKNADRKTLGEVASEEALLTEKARSNKLALDDIVGETIALSYLGAYGIDAFLGIVPPPASTIWRLGTSSGRSCPKTATWWLPR
jgi:pyruvate/2-oxoglutarate dehydrogenase complex dihydrolipoamide acyltransferase (E2) component